MTDEELDAMKYKVCCPLCDNFKCARGTEKCEAELWKKWRMKKMANELSVEDVIEVFKFMKRGVLEESKEDKLLDIAIKALERIRWIPVSERLPEENGQYLITVKYKPEADYENIYAEHGEWIDGQWDMFCFGHCGEVEGIVAWMPLPQPYKAEGSESE